MVSVPSGVTVFPDGNFGATADAVCYFGATADAVRYSGATADAVRYSGATAHADCHAGVAANACERPCGTVSPDATVYA